MTTKLVVRNKGLVLHWGHDRFYLDSVLLMASLGLLLLGFVMVASASLHLGEKMANDSFYFLKHQLVHITLGLLSGWLVASVELETWKKWSMLLYFLGIVLLLLVLIPGVGKVVNGSSRWVNLFGLRIQVSEVFKLIAVIYMAGYIDRNIQTVRH